MTHPADARKTAGTLALFGLAGFAAAAAVWHFSAPVRAPEEDRMRAAAMATAAPLARTTRTASPLLAPPLPASLAGTEPPRLPIDERGHLRKARGVRDFFDYFLTARSEMPPAALDALVHQQLAAQLDGTTAQREALDVWQHYKTYLKALDSLSQLFLPASAAGSTSTGDLDAMRSSLDARASLASRTLGPDWSEAFFGPDWRHAHYMIERWRIQRDSTLTDAQKAARQQALDASLPPEERTAREKHLHAQQEVRAVGQLEQQGMTLEQLRANATQQFGAQAAERIVNRRRDDDAWRAKYAEYAVQRARIDAAGLSPAERDARIAQLRQRMFNDPTEILRAGALDQRPRP